MIDKSPTPPVPLPTSPTIYYDNIEASPQIYDQHQYDYDYTLIQPSLTTISSIQNNTTIATPPPPSMSAINDTLQQTLQKIQVLHAQQLQLIQSLEAGTNGKGNETISISIPDPPQFIKPPQPPPRKRDQKPY